MPTASESKGRGVFEEIEHALIWSAVAILGLWFLFTEREGIAAYRKGIKNVANAIRERGNSAIRFALAITILSPVLTIWAGMDNSTAITALAILLPLMAIFRVIWAFPDGLAVLYAADVFDPRVEKQILRPLMTYLAIESLIGVYCLLIPIETSWRLTVIAIILVLAIIVTVERGWRKTTNLLWLLLAAMTLMLIALRAMDWAADNLPEITSEAHTIRPIIDKWGKGFIYRLLHQTPTKSPTPGSAPTPGVSAIPMTKPEMEAYMRSLDTCPDEEGKDEVIRETTTRMITLNGTTCWTRWFTNMCNNTVTSTSSMAYPRPLPYGIWIDSVPPQIIWDFDGLGETRRPFIAGALRIRFIGTGPLAMTIRCPKK